MSGLLLAWAVEAGLVTYRSFQRERRAPLPAEFVGTFIVFGFAGAIAEIPNARTMATVFGWGVVVATLLELGPDAQLERIVTGSTSPPLQAAA